jgi:hypothetical protein
MDEKEKREKLSAFLYKGFADWQAEQFAKDAAEYELRGRRGDPPRLKSLTHFAINVLHVSQASFSQWAGGMRIPDASSKAELIEFYGPQLYRILDEPEMLPASMRPLAEMWPDLNGDEREFLIDQAQEMRERRKQEQPNAQTENQTE